MSVLSHKVSANTAGEKLLISIVSLLIIIPPLLVIPGIKYPYTPPKALFFFLLVDIGIIILLFFRKKPYNRHIVQFPLTILLFGILLTQMLSAFFGESILRSFFSNLARMTGIITLLHAILYYFILLNVCTTLTHWKFFIKIAVWTSVPIAVVAVMQYIFPGKVLDFRGALVMISTLGSSMYLSEYLVVNFFLTCWLATQEQMIQRRYIVIAILHFIAIILAGQRGVYIGFTAGIVVVALYVIYRRLHTLRKDRAFLKRAKIIIIAALLIIGSFSIGVQQIKKHFPDSQLARTADRLTDFSLQSTTVQTRLIVWGIALDAFREKQLLGWGPENFELAFNTHYNPKLLRLGLSETWFDKAHNSFLNTLVDTGIVGGVLFLILWGAIFYYARYQPILIGLFTALFLSSLVEIDSITWYILFYFLLSFITWLTLTKQGAMELPDWPYNISRTFITIPVVILMIASVIYHTLFAIAGLYMYRSMFRDFRTAQFHKFIDTFTIGYNLAVLSPYLRENAIHDSMGLFLEMATDRNLQVPFSVLFFLRDKMFSILPLIAKQEIRTYYVLGKFLTVLGHDDNSELQDVEKVLQIGLSINNKRQIFLLSLGELYLKYTQLFNAEKAIQFFQQAVQLDENAADSHWALAEAYLFLGKKDMAIPEAKAALALNYIVNTPRIALKMFDVFCEYDDVKALSELYQRVKIWQPRNKILQQQIAPANCRR